MPQPSRDFAVAARLADMALADVVAAELAKAAPPDQETTALLRKALTNYAAAAIVMPYRRFLEAAMESRYDVDLLCARFGVSYEQAAHRLVTLGRPSAKGVPFFLLKIDAAGVVSKRCSSDGAWLARAGGGCARWGLQRAFRLPGETISATVEAPDDESYLTFARAVRPLGERGAQLIVLGCAAKHRAQIALADSAPSAATPIGSTCSLCERPRCPDRALPSVTGATDANPMVRPYFPYPVRPT